MRTPLFVRPLTLAEEAALAAGLHSADAFTLRRSQILRASARREPVAAIAEHVGCAPQTVRNTLHAFHAHGLAALERGSTAPHAPRRSFDDAALERLQTLVHRSPRDCGHRQSLWTLTLLVESCVSEGVTAQRVSDETVRQALRRLGLSWKRAKHWLVSPDVRYIRKKAGAIG